MSDRQLPRKVSICNATLGVCSLLCQPVAKTPCQKRAIFSCSGRFVLIMR